MSLTSRSLPRIALMLVLALVILSMIVPSSALDFLRFEYGWVDRMMVLLFTISPGADLDHLIAFGLLGFMAPFGWPRGRSWQVALSLLSIATIVEFVQLWIPGREAAVSHALLDVIGGMAGFAFAWVLGYAWGGKGLPEEAASR
ncbi:VanZ family protein [Ramlibacter sp. AN1133]|uniref:VanZ family protein n=1 Tax=Ramlibacter sp. AN1133 TaxID=3133429 RepID=UPI0030BD91A2